MSGRWRAVVADDEQSVVEAIGRILADGLDIDVRIATDGNTALALVRDFEPHIVLLDIDMPGLSGIEVCRQIKEGDAEERFTPVVLITGHADEALRLEGQDAGADDYVQKPVSNAGLRARVRGLLRSRALHEQVARLRDEVAALRNELLGRSRDERVPPRRQEITVLFSDIRRFTQISDQLEPEDVTSVVDRYLREMSETVIQAGGIVNKVMGDGLLVLFETDGGDAAHRLMGIRCALAMNQTARKLQAFMHASLPENLAIGIGVHAGEVTLGTIGDGVHSEFTALGSAVNLAARLQGLATGGQIIASEATYGPLGGRVVVQNERRQTLRGFAHPVQVAEIVDLR